MTYQCVTTQPSPPPHPARRGQKRRAYSPRYYAVAACASHNSRRQHSSFLCFTAVPALRTSLGLFPSSSQLPPFASPCWFFTHTHTVRLLLCTRLRTLLPASALAFGLHAHTASTYAPFAPAHTVYAHPPTRFAGCVLNCLADGYGYLRAPSPLILRTRFSHAHLPRFHTPPHPPYHRFLLPGCDQFPRLRPFQSHASTGSLYHCKTPRFTHTRTLLHGLTGFVLCSDARALWAARHYTSSIWLTLWRAMLAWVDMPTLYHLYYRDLCGM